MKSRCLIGYIPVRRLNGNQTYLLTGLFAHNLARELHVIAEEPRGRSTLRRGPLWAFEKLETLRRRLIQRAGRLSRPNGILTLTISAGRQLKERLLHYLETLWKAP